MQYNSGDTAWVLGSAALVLFMTPGLAFFYAGMVRTKNVLGMLMQNYVVIGLVSVIWVLVGYSLAFGVDLGGHGIIGTLHFAGLAHMKQAVPGYSGPIAQTIPPLAFVVFQMMFAIITPALITGSTADRLKFGGFVAVITLWAVLVYAPVAHWVFSPTGWLFKLGAEDFAGGTVVHINAGVAGLALAMVVGRRRGWPKEPMPPHALPLTLLGAGILWFGWFGFNAGSALAANQLAAQGFVNTNTATAAALLGWIATEKLRNGKSTTLGAVHLVGGVTGALLIGLFGTSTVGGADGLFYGGGLGLLGHQAVAVVVVALFSFVVTFAIGKLVDVTMGLRVDETAEREDLDTSQHAETAYELGLVLARGLGVSSGGHSGPPAAPPPPQAAAAHAGNPSSSTGSSGADA